MLVQPFCALVATVCSSAPPKTTFSIGGPKRFHTHENPENGFPEPMHTADCEFNAMTDFGLDETAGRSPGEIPLTELVDELASALEGAIGEIYDVNTRSRILALNARIEAARAGRHGAAFGIVAEEMQSLSSRTSDIAHEMANRTRDKTSELAQLIDSNVRGFQGTRLSDIALVNIDLIDRNLYERTCDVRWWATDGSLTSALANPTADACDFASKRLGVILDAYTVYFDLVLCDLNGKVIANGRPDEYRSIGEDQSTAEWFRKAIQTRSGNEYGFQPAHNSTLVGGEPSLIYSCSVRKEGCAKGKCIGALGIIFDWQSLAQPIVENPSVHPSEKQKTSAYILNRDGIILASDQHAMIGDRLEIDRIQNVFENGRGHFQSKTGDREICVGHAKSPGFETSSTGWYSVVTQDLVLHRPNNK